MRGGAPRPARARRPAGRCTCWLTPARALPAAASPPPGARAAPDCAAWPRGCPPVRGTGRARAARTLERAARAGEPSAPASRPAPVPRAGARVPHEPGGGWVRHEPRAEHRYPQTPRRQPQVLPAWRTRLRPPPRSRTSRAAQRTPFRSSLWPRAHACRTSGGRAGELPRRWPLARRGARAGLVRVRAVRRDSAPRSAHCGPDAARLRSRPGCPRTATCARAGPYASGVACPPPAASLPERAAVSSSAGRRLRRSQGRAPAESARPPPRSAGHNRPSTGPGRSPRRRRLR